MSQPKNRRAARRAGSLNDNQAIPPVRRARSSAQTGKRMRRGNRRPSRRGIRIALIAVALFSALGVAGVAVVYAAYQNYRGQLPDAATLAAMEPPLDTHVYARDGRLIATFTDGGYHHEHVALADVSSLVLQATVDTEDRHFYENASWDLPRIIKAGWENLRGNGAAGGASTITEQLAKISFLTPERSFDRKVKQVILGIEIENNFSKNQILEMYLNRVDYGNHSTGIESAAKDYFHKSSKDLDLAEASMLAGLPQAPSDLNPLQHDAKASINPAAKERQRVVLQAMVNNGHITQQQADAAFVEPLTFHDASELNAVWAPHFVQYVKDYLDAHYGSAYVKPGGWEITTSIDPTLQLEAEQVLPDGISKIANQNAHDGALVSMDPRSGQILAMLGTVDYNSAEFGQFNEAVNAFDPGSTIKLFTYTAAIASRQFTVRTPIDTGPSNFDDGSGKLYQPLNYDRKWHGICPLSRCLPNSYNVSAVKVEAHVGINLITNFEIAAGISTFIDPQNRPAPNQYSATLGGLYRGITPLDLADGASTIASLGVHHDPAPILKIVDRATSKVRYAYDAAAAARRVIPQNVAYIISEVTSNDANRAAAFGTNGPLTLGDRRVSAKTGTAENFKANWTVGWTPSLLTVVLVSNPRQTCLNTLNTADVKVAQKHGIDPSTPLLPSDVTAIGLKPVSSACGPLTNGLAAAIGAAPIWNTYMKRALQGKPQEWYTRPPDVVAQGSGDNADFFLPGTETQPTICSYYAKVFDPNNPCFYMGTSAPAPPPTPSPTPAPGGDNQGGEPNPTPKPGH